MLYDFEPSPDMRVHMACMIAASLRASLETRGVSRDRISADSLAAQALEDADAVIARVCKDHHKAKDEDRS